MFRLPPRASFAAILTLAALAYARPAQAGPPLLCHPFNIGSAASLPWDGSTAFWQGRSDYNIANLVADIDRLLTPATPVIVRMETLRRAAIYASADANVAAQLYARLGERVWSARDGGRQDALALLDLAYVTEASRQLASLNSWGPFKGRGPALLRIVGQADGYVLVKKSLSLQPNDAALEFAAALIAADKDRAASAAHAARARAGASGDALLARNLSQLQ